MSSNRVDLTTIEQNRELYLRLAELDIAKLWEVLDEDLGEFNG